MTDPARLLQQLKAREEELVRLRAERHDLLETMQVAQKALEQIEHLEEAIKKLRGEAAEMRAALASERQDREILARDLEQARANEHTGREERNALEGLLAARTAHIQSLETRMRDLEGRLVATRNPQQPGASGHDELGRLSDLVADLQQSVRRTRDSVRMPRSAAQDPAGS